MGGIFVSADIIPFIPRPNHRNGLASFPRTSWSPVPPDDLAMDHVDTLPFESIWPCEYLAPYEEGCEVSQGETCAGPEADTKFQRAIRFP
jgi:hypothetical protein